MARPPKAETLASLIEHESCIQLRHPRCWDPTSRLKSQREEGAGLFQLTRAYTSTGQLRFDLLDELRHRYPKELYELTWNNVYSRADLQIRAGILESRDKYNQLKAFASTTYEAMAFADAAYNGGIRGLQQERRACGMSKDCDPSKWFGHVERYCLKSKVALYGNRNACDINRHHVYDVLVVKLNKYSAFFK